MSPEGETIAKIDGHYGPLIDAQALIERLAEPLAESAPIGFATAMECCTDDVMCGAYHALWQYLRLCNRAPAVRVDGPIYVAVAERLARAGRLNRVLITASADYSMLAHLAYGARLAGVEPAFDVVDRCATPLRLNAWYGAKNRVNVRTIQHDVLEFGDHGPYDLICTHSLLQLLPIERRGRLFERWRSCLGTEGRVCFSNRVWTTHIKLTPGELDRRAHGMVESVLEKLREGDVAPPCDRERLEGLILRYARREDERPPLPLSDIERWVAEAGLAIEIAVPAVEVVARARDGDPTLFPTERGPRMWFQLRPA